MTDAMGERCVLTGATSGIGRGLALALAARGAAVWALGRSVERLAALATDAESLPGSVTPVVADLERRRRRARG